MPSDAKFYFVLKAHESTIISNDELLTMQALHGRHNLFFKNKEINNIQIYIYNHFYINSIFFLNFKTYADRLSMCKIKKKNNTYIIY